MLLLCIVSVTALIAIAYWLPAILRFKQRYDFAKTLSGPSMLELIAASTKGGVLDLSTKCRMKYGTVFKIWAAFDLMVAFTDPDDVKTILKSNVLLDKGDAYAFLEPWLHKGLVMIHTADGWHSKRKFLTPSFNIQILSSFKETMADCCDILIERLTQVADGRPVDIHHYSCLFALDVICETAMGIKVNAQINEQSDFVQMTKQMCSVVQSRIFTPYKQFDFLYNWSADKKKLDKALAVLHGHTRRVIAERRQQLDAELPLNASDLETKPKRRPFLDLLLIAQRETGMLSDANIQEEVDTFTFGGHDTSSSAIAFTVFLLSKHPEVQQKVFEEVRGIHDDLQPMPYLESVIKESLRLFPPIPSIARQVKQPIRIGKHNLPAGVTVIVNVYLLHREPNHFKDPEVFRPERFAKDAAPMQPFAHLPFSGGARNCIGQKFAMIELKCTLSRLVREFEFGAVEGFQMQLVPEMVLKSLNGVMVRLRKRNVK